MRCSKPKATRREQRGSNGIRVRGRAEYLPKQLLLSRHARSLLENTPSREAPLSPQTPYNSLSGDDAKQMILEKAFGSLDDSSELDAISIVDDGRHQLQ